MQYSITVAFLASITFVTCSASHIPNVIYGAIPNHGLYDGHGLGYGGYGLLNGYGGGLNFLNGFGGLGLINGYGYGGPGYGDLGYGELGYGGIVKEGLGYGDIANKDLDYGGLIPGAKGYGGLANGGLGYAGLGFGGIVQNIPRKVYIDNGQTNPTPVNGPVIPRPDNGNNGPVIPRPDNGNNGPVMPPPINGGNGEEVNGESVRLILSKQK